jgi:excisionase family DNA binding protein
MHQEETKQHNSESSIRTNPPKLLSVAEASKYIGISERYLRSLIAERKVQTVRIGGRVVLRLVDLDRWIESKLEGGAA